MNDDDASERPGGDHLRAAWIELARKTQGSTDVGFLWARACSKDVGEAGRFPPGPLSGTMGA